MEKITDLVLFKKHGEKKKKNRSGFSLKKKKNHGEKCRSGFCLENMELL